MCMRVCMCVRVCVRVCVCVGRAGVCARVRVYSRTYKIFLIV